MRPMADVFTHPIREVAKQIPCSERYIGDLLRSGRISGRKVGRSWRMTDEDIAGLLEHMRRGPTTTEPAAADDRGLTETARRRSSSA